MKITEDIREYAAKRANSVTSQKVEGFEPPGGERKDVCAANGRRPRLRAQPSQLVEKGAEVYAKA